MPGDTSNFQGKHNDICWTPGELTAQGSSLSTLDCTVFLSTTLYLGETGFSVVTVIKRKYHTEQKYEDKHGTESKGGGVQIYFQNLRDCTT